MNYSIWKSENGFEPAYNSGVSFLEVIISGVLFLGVIYLMFGILAAKLFVVDKLLRLLFPNWFVDAVPEFILSLLITAMFPPFALYGLMSNEHFGPGFLLGGVTAWTGWILCITYFYPNFIVIVLALVAGLAAYFLLILFAVRFLGWLSKNINFQPILGFFKNRK